MLAYSLPVTKVAIDEALIFCAIKIESLQTKKARGRFWHYTMKIAEKVHDERICFDALNFTAIGNLRFIKSNSQLKFSTYKAQSQAEKSSHALWKITISQTQWTKQIVNPYINLGLKEKR